MLCHCLPEKELIILENKTNCFCFYQFSRTPSSSSSDCSRQYLNYQQNNGYRKEKEVRAKWNDYNVYEPVTKEKSLKSGPCWLEKGFPDSGDESVR